MTAPHEITGLLVAARAGDAGAMDRLVPLVYDELRRIAHRQLQGERRDHTIATTGLVHEAYLRLVDQSRADIVDRSHFFAMAATVMRRVLVDYARRNCAERRGGGASIVALDPARGVDVASPMPSDDIVAVDEALERLAALEPRLAKVVELRFFGGLTEEQIATVLGVTERTVRRDWTKARAWLRDALDSHVN